MHYDQCSKVKFANETVANQHIQRMVERKIPKATFMHSYQCRFCNSWHLTSVADKNMTMLQQEIVRLNEQVNDLTSQLSKIATNKKSFKKELYAKEQYGMLRKDVEKLRKQLQVVNVKNTILEKQLLDLFKENERLKSAHSNK